MLPICPSGALKAYNKAIEIKRGAAAGNGSANGVVQLPARLLNNAAVLHLRAGDSQAAYDLMAQAVQTAGDAGLGNLGPLAQVSMARVMCTFRLLKPALPAGAPPVCLILLLVTCAVLPRSCS